jgi:hypothetical protein
MTETAGQSGKRARHLEAAADISDDGLYRYWLSRRLSTGERAVVFVGLNPSTADAADDDPTVRRCMGFARRWGFDWLWMGNLNAWRSTDPRDLPKDSLTAVGPRNEAALRWLAPKGEILIAAWGQNKLNSRAAALARQIGELPHVRCLGQNRNGTPKHPLRLPAAREPMEYLTGLNARDVRAPS